MPPLIGNPHHLRHSSPSLRVTRLTVNICLLRQFVNNKIPSLLYWGCMPWQYPGGSQSISQTANGFIFSLFDQSATQLEFTIQPQILTSWLLFCASLRLIDIAFGRLSTWTAGPPSRLRSRPCHQSAEDILSDANDRRKQNPVLEYKSPVTALMLSPFSHYLPFFYYFR